MKLSQANVRDLLAKNNGQLSASIYIPTSPVANTQDGARLKNALQDIKNNPAYDDRELGAIIATIYTDLIESDDFWDYQDNGLAVLFNRDGYEFFNLPFEVTESHYLTDHFVVSPLVLIAGAYTGYYLLDVNYSKAQLYYAARGKLEAIEVPDMPKAYDDTVNRGRFNNHSPGEDGNNTEDEKRYLKLIADAVIATLADSDTPLLLAGTSNRTGNIREYLSALPVMQNTLVGSFEKANTEELYNLTMPVVLKNLRAVRDSAISTLAGTPPELVVMGKAEIIEAADLGRVATLYLPAYHVTNDGVAASSTQNIIVEVPSDVEDIENMISKVLGQSGNILSLEIGAYDILNEPKAICRY